VVRKRVGKSKVWQCECTEDGYQHTAPFDERTILAAVNQEIGLTALMSEHDRFYAALKPGQIVHYCNGGEQFIRCEVVEGDIPFTNSLLKGHVLKPIGLIGYAKYDLPSRMPNGEINYPPATRLDRMLQPNYTMIWENPQCSYRQRCKTDPTTAPLLDLSVPPMTSEQEEKARLWKLVEQIREAANLPSEPEKILQKIAALIDLWKITTFESKNT
jgi:hypothetical protein